MYQLEYLPIAMQDMLEIARVIYARRDFDRLLL